MIKISEVKCDICGKDLYLKLHNKPKQGTGSEPRFAYQGYDVCQDCLNKIRQENEKMLNNMRKENNNE